MYIYYMYIYLYIYIIYLYVINKNNNISKLINSMSHTYPDKFTFQVYRI